MGGVVGKSARDAAAFWGVSVRTVQRWIAKGMDPFSVEWMREWAKAAKRVPDAVDLKLRELSGEIPAGGDDEALAAFLEGDDIDDDPKSDLEDLLRMKTLIKHKLKRAIEGNHANDLKLYNSELARVTEAIRKTRLMQERLGIFEGDTLSRASAERFAVNIVWWCMRSVDTAKADLCKRLCDLSFPEEVLAVLEPYLLSSLVYLPITRSVEQDRSGASLPGWFVDALRRALDEFVFDDGEGDGDD